MSAKAEKFVKPKESEVQNGNGPATNGSNGKFEETHPRWSRLLEKNALIGLNNRLAGIIDRNRQLESENVHLTAEVKTTEEKLQSVSQTLKTTFENENKELRKQLDEAEKEKAKLVLSETNVRNKLKDVEEKLKKRDDENAKLQKEFDTTKTKAKKLEDDLKKEKENVAKLLKEKSEVEDDNRKLKQENEDFKKFNEEHLMTQVELKNALKNKSEELTVKAMVHEREMKEVSTKTQTFLQKLGEKAKKEFEKKLEEAIKALRKDCEKQMDVHKKEQDQLHQMKEKDLKAQLEKLSETLKTKGAEIEEITVKVENANKKIAELEGDKLTLEKKVKGAEEKLAKTEGKFSKELKDLEKRLKDLQDDKDKLIGEYQDLMEIKVALDNEISTYRNLLEGEEDRLQIIIEESKPKAVVPEPAKKLEDSGVKKEAIAQ